MIKFLTSLFILLPSFCYGKTLLLTSKNFVYFQGTITQESIIRASLAVDEKLEKRRDSGKDYPIYVVIDSFGGSIRGALAFALAAKNFTNIHFIATKAGSAAFMMWQMSPGSRITVKNPSLMIHPGTSTIFFIDREQFIKTVQASLEIHEAFQNNSIASTLISKQQYQDWISKGEKFFTPEEISTYVIADETVELKCSKEIKTCPIKRSE